MSSSPMGLGATPAERKNKRQGIQGLTAALRIHVESDHWPLIGEVVEALEFMNSEIDRVRSADELIWQRRFYKLMAIIQEANEVGNWHIEFDEIPEEPFSDATEYFISNCLHVVDNEECAKKLWGDRYFRVVKV